MPGVKNTRDISELFFREDDAIICLQRRYIYEEREREEGLIYIICGNQTLRYISYNGIDKGHVGMR